ncbi:hypothetical protein GOARA_067_00610 [Gordonia araii NBRC 100433]|uniref:DNA mimic protein DMP19 C-terminal domain-containing protein n=1 Tax=Gordonia araii NBRC 100433 TaxID=1073574 RepID=G7H5Z7_9ACTN|nr:hypothetical protein [Gordonia araii]NNG99256.1 hypothetical protein [Gordonia araii NBRC 100433]GAB11319.1 hypothetical protein GOARA_067_00610 [Gordonia araii NBRC 100433]
MSTYDERLLDLGARASEVIDDETNLDGDMHDLVYTTVLAANFEYQVKNGGFEQLIYNAGTERLEQYDDLLSALNAPVALSYYRRAIARCAEDVNDFERFMATYPAEPTRLGVDIMQIGVEYLTGAVPFASEIGDFMDHAEASLPPRKA